MMTFFKYLLLVFYGWVLFFRWVQYKFGRSLDTSHMVWTWIRHALDMEYTCSNDALTAVFTCLSYAFGSEFTWLIGLFFTLFL